ncbi:DUF4142 domain-containing protein [Caenispirillum bisanense]|uniref:Predicted outer membrane protein n=1 Tax=Caenispirillum bisanense TaxID=414052 RepID=A0A286GE45_9PROT|nr:DUF4142 domain-containing protein [Caenispirillum bisanense]SOD93795.1 Predicted outer membrane protein [Caenispirillum bisanense]
MRTFTTAAAVVALMTAVPAVAQQTQATQPQAQQQSQSGQQQKQGEMSQQDRKFAKEAATGNMMEVQLGELAQKQGQNDQVKQFGERMAQEHGKAQDKLKQILQQAKAEVPQQLPQDAQQKVDRLTQQKGEQFDRAYMEMMVKDHEKDLQAYRQYTKQGQFQALVTYADQTTPILEQHYQQAQDVAKQVGAQVQASSGQSQGKSSQQQAMANDPGTEVVVDQGATDVGVQQPAPNVTVVDPEPQVTVQTPEPQVSVDMPKPEVEIDQAKPDVNVQKQGQADVTIVERDTQQTQQTAQQPQTQERSQPQPLTDDDRSVEPGTDTTALDIQQDEIERQRERTALETGQPQTAQMGQASNLQDLVGAAVYGETGEQVGEISDVLMNQQGEAERVVIDRGGFLGIGEKTIAIDMDDLTVAQDRVQVNMTDQQISELPEWEGPGN